MNKRKEIKITSSLEEMFRVEQFVEEISDEYLLYNNYFSNMIMAVSEAVKNAIVHGNRSERTKHVRIWVESTREGLWIKVANEGDGFDSIPFTRDGNFSGINADPDKNGMWLINKLSDDVRFQNHGKVIEMLFRINGIDDSIMERRASLMRDFFRVFQQMNT
jgi:serine/threonine-protein kinase RsbW